MRNIDLVTAAGELICVLGPNGAGKSTLLKTLAGLLAPLSGTVWLEGIDLHTLPLRQLAQKIGIVLTEKIIPENLTVRELMVLGRYPFTDWWGNLTERDEEIIRRALAAVQGEDLAERPLQKLSDGERQRIFVGRALAQEPRLLVLDEPTIFLDLSHRVEIMGLLRTLSRTEGRTIILSTHDLELALRSADKLWLISASGELVAGVPEDLVLNGALASAFNRENVEFVAEKGTFRIHPGPLQPIGLHGEGLVRHWTAHALERIGYQPVFTASLPLTVTIKQSAGRWRWFVSQPERESIYDSLETLLTHLDTLTD